MKLSYNALGEAGITPHGDRYLVERIEIDTRHSVDGTNKVILIAGEPRDLAEKMGYYLARIVAKGNGHRLETDVTVPMHFDEGDIVMVEAFSGREIQVGTHTFTIVNQVDVLAGMELPGPVAVRA